MMIVVDTRPTEVTGSDCQTKRSKTDVSELVTDLTHLGAATGYNIVMDAHIGKLAKVGKRHGGGRIDPEQRDECHPEHLGESNLKLRKRDASKTAVQRFHAIESLQEPVHESSVWLGVGSCLCIALQT